MEILSISIDDKARQELAAVQKRLGFKSRSKLLRNAVQSLVRDYQVLDGLKGEVEIVFIVSYKEFEKNHVSNIIHGFKDDIISDLHQHRAGSGIDVLTVRAPAGRVRRMFGVLKRNKCVNSVAYLVVD